MNKKDLYEGVAHVDDEVLARSEKKKRRSWWTAAAAAVMAVVIAGTYFFYPGGGTIVTNAIAEPTYPEMAQFPDMSSGKFDDEGYEKWWNDVRAQQRESGYADGLEGFLTSGIQQFLSDSGEENKVYAPVNVYMALSMLAEVTDGNSRQQILDLMGKDSIEELRQQAGDIWNSHYRNDGAVTSILANSLWLNQDMKFVQDTLNTLANSYYASSYQGEMGSEELDKALQDWVNAQTGNLLKDQVSGLKMDKNTILALVSTVWFQAKWLNEFNPANNDTRTFHSPSGDMDCEFMNRSGTGVYYYGDGFSAVPQYLDNQGGTMWFILPDEGVSLDQLLENQQVMDFILTGGKLEQQKYMIINFSTPKFDVSSKIDLKDGLQAMGITDVFSEETSDFSPMLENPEGVFLSKAEHGARVSIDEKGVTGAAYTAMMMAGAGRPPEEEIDFVLDRPFLFVVSASDGMPMFVGTVNQPAK